MNKLLELIVDRMRELNIEVADVRGCYTDTEYIGNGLSLVKTYVMFVPTAYSSAIKTLHFNGGLEQLFESRVDFEVD